MCCIQVTFKHPTSKSPVVITLTSHELIAQHACMHACMQRLLIIIQASRTPSARVQSIRQLSRLWMTVVMILRSIASDTLLPKLDCMIWTAAKLHKLICSKAWSWDFWAKQAEVPRVADCCRYARCKMKDALMFRDWMVDATWKILKISDAAWKHAQAMKKKEKQQSSWDGAYQFCCLPLQRAGSGLSQTAASWAHKNSKIEKKT